MAKASKDDAKTLFAKVDQAMDGFEMPRGYRWDKGARYVRLEESNKSQKFAMIMSISFVFLLMGVLFESFVLPLAVIIAVPFAFLGVYWTLFLTGTPLDMMSMIGTVILIGVVVNNAIVLVDLTNRQRGQGMDRTKALMEAGRHRFRPILMTTFTTVCGLIPMALGNSKMIGMPYSPLGSHHDRRTDLRLLPHPGHRAALLQLPGRPAQPDVPHGRRRHPEKKSRRRNPPFLRQGDGSR